MEKIGNIVGQKPGLFVQFCAIRRDYSDKRDPAELSGCATICDRWPRLKAARNLMGEKRFKNLREL